MRVGDELRGISASFSEAAKRSSIGLVLSIAIALSRERRPENFLASLRRRLFFSIELFFAIKVSWVSAFEAWFEILASLPEREVECGQQRARLVVGLGGRANRDVHAPDIRRLVVVDLRENDVLLDADGVVAAAVEALRIEAAEVTHARQRDRDQPIEELVHASLSQRHLAADRLAVAQLVGGDRLARLGDDRLLPGDLREVGGRRVDLLAIVDALADAHVDDHLLDGRHLHRILVAVLLGELLAHYLVEMGAQARRHPLFVLLLRLRRAIGFGLALVAALALIAALGLLGLLRLLGLLIALLRLRTFRRLRGFFFLVSHRSQLPSAWTRGPSYGPGPRPRI